MTHEQGNPQFDQALEATLRGRETPADSLSGDDQAVIAAASVLAEMDFSAAYGERAALRRRLLEQHGESRGVWSVIGDRNTMFTSKRRFVFAAAAVIMVAMLALVRFSPALADSRQQVATWVSSSTLSSGMQQVVFTLVGSGPTVAITHVDGETVEIIFTSVDSIEEAQAAANFTLKQPTALPDGFTLKSAAVAEDGSWVNLDYGNDAGDLILFSQTTVPQPDLDGASEAGLQANLGSDDGAPSTNSSDEPQAGVVSLNVVQWEEGGVYYQLSGTLSEAALQAIADSMQ